jgi:hypothetical protein
MSGEGAQVSLGMTERQFKIQVLASSQLAAMRENRVQQM